MFYDLIQYISKIEIETGINAAQIYDDSTGSAYCYKTPSGEYYYLPSFEHLKNENYVTEKVTDGDFPTDTPESQPPVTTTQPTPKPILTSTPVPSNKPGVQPQQTAQPMPTQSSAYDTETKERR